MNNLSERLYYNDPYLTTFRARVVQGGTRVVLDRTAFYPESGGQPHDLGTLGGHHVMEVVDEDGAIVHVVSNPLNEGDVEAAID